MSKIASSDAMMKVLYDWGVKRIYGLPGGSFDSTMNAIHNWQDKIQYIGVRHEEVGGLAAVAEAKLTGKIAVMFGSAGPGAAHLLNPLHDAKLDNIPVLALVGQVPSDKMNTDFFQELPENPMFSSASVYNRTVMTPEQLPQVVDTAIRKAFAKKGPAVVVIPKDFGWAQIEDNYVSSAQKYSTPQWQMPAKKEDVEATLDLLEKAQRPIIYFGRGAQGAADQLRELATILKLPMVSSYLAKGILEGDEEFYMLSTGRVATKPGVDVARAADFVIFAGTNFEFPMFSEEATFVDVNLQPSVIGARHQTKLGILADVPTFLDQLIKAAKARYGNDGAQFNDKAINHDAWYDAAVEDKQQWDAWLQKRAERTDNPVGFERVYQVINQLAADDAIFGVDVGNVNIAVARLLSLGGERRQVTSPLYATMGFGMPASIAAALEYPEREVWSLSGDGGIAMVIPDLVTQAEHQLPVMNVVFTNKSLGYIEAEQDDTHQPHSGVKLQDVDFAKVAEGFQVAGLTVHKAEQLESTLKQAKQVIESGKPVLVDIKITNERMLPVEQFPHRRSGEPDVIADFDKFVAHFEAEALEPFGEILDRHGVESF
ncbi:pyruvate oxidase [Psychrobacter sp. FDAARGOS_221]|uniref:pyruvate oxidase n=1 Tax=Psychrobacter sp. FDAARGOS_221 TaxID=1975705 RepID=UPI000BB55514|nr:pyruvate oxidase [Psychrobacter sp. FDAARGOS_221]PNK61173.1 pyruvate oxidase [Psychrobacter sp. FDAARGOS_221]